MSNYNELWISLKETFLPKDVRDIPLQNIDNYALKLNKATQWERDERGNPQKALLFKAERNARAKMILSNFSSINFEELAKRQEKSAYALFSGQGFLSEFTLKPEGAWLTGLGTESVYETGFTLHHIYGTPYMPSSGLKGYLRSFLVESLFNGDELKAFHESKLLCDLFGCPKELIEKNKNQQDRKSLSYYAEIFKNNKDLYGFEERQGCLVFFDMLPLGEPEIAPDIMNPHFPTYYGGKQKTEARGEGLKKGFPVDYDTPVPIHFLTVKGDIKYQTFIGIRECLDFKQEDAMKWKEIGIDLSLFSSDNPSAFISTVFTKALQVKGIGAKTAVGYGYMSPTQVQGQPGMAQAPQQQASVAKEPTYLGRAPRRNDEVQARILKTGNTDNLQLLITPENQPTVSCRYGPKGFASEQIGSIITVKIVDVDRRGVVNNVSFVST